MAEFVMKQIYKVTANQNTLYPGEFPPQAFQRSAGMFSEPIAGEEVLDDDHAATDHDGVGDA